MSVTLDLSDVALARLTAEAEAEKRGITLDQLVDEMAVALPADEVESIPRDLGFFAMGRSTSGRHAADADEMLVEGFGRD